MSPRCHLARGVLVGRLSWREQLQGSGELVRACAFPSLRRAHPLVAGMQNTGRGTEGRTWGLGGCVRWGGLLALVGLPRPWRGAAGLCGSGGSEHCQLGAGRADGPCGWRRCTGHVNVCDTPASGLEGHQLPLLANPGLEPGPLPPLSSGESLTQNLVMPAMAVPVGGAGRWDLSPQFTAIPPQGSQLGDSALGDTVMSGDICACWDREGCPEGWGLWE